MPLVDVELVRDDPVHPALASRVADAISETLAARPGSTWVRLRILPRAHYAESGGVVPPEVRPIFISIIQAHSMGVGARRTVAEQLASAVGAACDSPPENVHVIFEPSGTGRVAFGGKLVEE